MPDFKWYVVHTYSGHEAKAKQAIEDRMKAHGLGEFLDQVLIPSEQVVEVVKGVKRTTSRKFFPGYLLVKMELNDRTYHVVKSTPKVTGFVGGTKNPPAVPEGEVRRITQQITDGAMRQVPKVEYEKGENVRITEGPFANFTGLVDEVKPDKGKLRVMVSIFGRSTPVELDFVQVEKAE